MNRSREMSYKNYFVSLARGDGDEVGKKCAEIWSDSVHVLRAELRVLACSCVGCREGKACHLSL